MSHAYEVRLYGTDGVLRAVFDNWRTLEVIRKVNGMCTHQLGLDDRDERTELFVLDSIVEVRRRLSTGWYTEYAGFHRTPQRQITENGNRIFTSYGRCFKDLLRRRGVWYPTGSPEADKVGPADDMMKEFVYENVGAGATLPNRFADGVTANFLVAVDLSAAPEWDGSRQYRGVLEILQEIADQSGVDFDVVWTKPLTFTFHTYYPRLGTDRTLSAVFALEYGNLTAPSHTKSRTEEVNSVLVLGQGQEDERETAERTTSARLESPWNRCESTHDARQESEITALEDIGDAELVSGAAHDQFSGQVIQVPYLTYGLHYFLGDLVRVRYGALTLDKKIVQVRISVQSGVEEITPEFSDQSF